MIVSPARSHYGTNILENKSVFLSKKNSPGLSKKNNKTKPSKELAYKIIGEAVSGNRGAIKSLVQHLTPVIQASVAHVLTRSKSYCSSKPVRQEVADHCQDVFMLLFKNNAKVLRSWEPQKGMNLNSFISLVSKRLVISELRKKYYFHCSEDVVFDENIEQYLKLPDEEEQFVSRHLLLQLVSNLKSEISELGYAIFVQIFLYENTVEEVALKFGLSKNAIYVWKNRLRTQVKKIADDLELIKQPAEDIVRLNPKGSKRGHR